MTPHFPFGARLPVALLAGAAFPLGLAPFDLPAAAVLSVAALLLLLTDLSPRQTFRLCFAYGLGLFGVGSSWVYISIHDHGGDSVLVAGTLTLAFVLLLALCFALPFSAYGLVRRRNLVLAALAFPSLWVLVEWLRGWLFTGFPWLYLGNAFIDTPLAGWAPVGGVLTLSWIGAFTAVAVAGLRDITHAPAGVFAGLLAAVLLWLAGDSLSDRPWTQPREQSLSVAMVQPNFTLEQKWDEQSLTEILLTLRRAAERNWDKDLVIWPESAVPALRHEMQPFLELMDRRAERHDTALITGVPVKDFDEYYNAVTVLGNGQGDYFKRHLVPFGEYVPLESLLRGAIGFFDLPMSAFSAGAADQPLLEVKGIPVATAICYEIVFQDMMAESATEAELLLTVSNDSWFGDSIAPHQHLQMARMRALENAKPLVRATNGGITAIADHRGQLTAKAPQHVPALLEGEVTPRRGQTPFNRLGSLPVVLLSLVLLGLTMWLRRQRNLPFQD